MNDPFKSLLLLVVILFAGSAFAQHDNATFQVTFNKDIPENTIVTFDRASIASDTEFSFIGLSAYESSTKTETELSFRLNDGDSWSEWQNFRFLTENVEVERRTYEADPIVSEFEQIQFSSTIDGSMVLRFFVADGTVPESETLQDPQSNGCDCGQPSFCDRDCWCPDGDCEPLEAAEETTPTHVIVHHSAGFGQSDNFQAVVAYYYDLHVNTNGWNDLGYNWLIDADGVVYEARGSMTQGAHFNCVNGATTGICLIGNFVQELPTDEAMETLETLIAWEFCDKEISPMSIEYHEPSQLDLNTISTHLDGNPSPSENACNGATVCPGAALYNVLDITRQNVSELDCFNPFTSIAELYKEQVEVYPNPFTEDININFQNSQLLESAEYSLTDIEGRKVNVLVEHIDGQSIVKTKGLTSGIYFLKVLIEDELLTFKLVKR